MIRIAVLGTTEVFVLPWPVPPGRGAAPSIRAWLDARWPLDADELDEIRRAYGNRGLRLEGDMSRPLRAPHYTTSPAGMFGGRGRPGEVSLATCGALVLSDATRLYSGILCKLPAVLRAGHIRGRPAAPIALVLGTDPR